MQRTDNEEKADKANLCKIEKHSFFPPYWISFRKKSNITSQVKLRLIKSQQQNKDSSRSFINIIVVRDICRTDDVFMNTWGNRSFKIAEQNT